jgi:outer membrane receptor protein involved in Fe transport
MDTGISTVRVCLLLLVLLTFPSAARPQQASLMGHVTDAATSHPVAGAHIVIRETGRMTESDASGQFSFRVLPSGRYTLSVRHIAYVMIERTLVIDADAESVDLHLALQPGSIQTEEVIVRSARTASTYGSTPFPVTVPADEEFMRPALPTVPDALARVPGIALARDGSWATSLSVRGMGRSGVVTLIDDARIETSNDLAGPLSLITIHDLERVEVVKGPASSLDGTGALGGSVHFISKRPAFGDNARLGAEYAVDAGLVNGSAGQFLALEGNTGRFAARLSGSRRKAGNTHTPDGILENSGFSDFSLSGTLGVELLAGQSLYLSYQRVQAEDAGLPGGVPIALPARATYTLARRELTGLEYRIPNMSPAITLVTVRASRQQIVRNVEIIQNPSLTLTPHAIHTTNSVQGEVRLLPAAGVLVTTGVDLWQRGLESWRERRQVTTGQITGERPLPVSRFLSAGLFMQGEWGIVPDRLTATLGARHDWIHIHNDEVWSPEYVITGGVKQSPPPGSRMLWSSRSARDASWSANAGLLYRLSPTIDLSGLCATAFRSPSLEERYDFIDLGTYVRLGNPDLHAEQSLSLNAGIRFAQDDLHIRGDGFVNTLTDMVAELPGTFEGRNAYVRANIGKARLYGYELSAEHQLASWCVLSGTLAAVRGEDLLNHTDLPQIPPWSGTVSLCGSLPEAGAFTLSAAWAVRQGRPGGDESTTPGYVVMDADLSTAGIPCIGAAFTLRAGVRNILDRSYRLHLSTLRGVVRSEPGRNIVASLTVTL